MSQTTYSFSPNKKARTFSQLSNSTNRGTSYMLTAPTAITRAGPKRGVGGSGVQKAGTAKSKNKVKQRIPYNWMTERMFPRHSWRILNYGINFYGHVLTTTQDEAGSLKMLRGQPGKQCWAEFYGLPLYWPKKTSGGITIGGEIISSMSLMQLMSRTSYANIGNQTQIERKSATGSGGVSSEAMDPNTDALEPILDKNGAGGEPVQDTMTQLSFIYNGGYQKHTFINHTNYQQWIEIFEAIPKVPLFDWVENSSDQLQYDAVGTLILADFQDSTIQNVDLASNNGQYVDELTDRMIRLNSSCKRTLQRYKCSKPITVCLAPGEQFVYTMDFPPFKFNESAFMEHLRTVTMIPGSAHYDVLNRPTSVPRFTKKLVVRSWGEIAHSDVSATNNNAYTGALQIAPTNLFHLQEELHNTRYCPSLNRKQTEFKDLRTVTNDYSLHVFNDDTENNEGMDL